MESKTEQQSGTEKRLSWHELNTYNNAKLALRQINEAISHADNSDGKNEILRKAGEFVTEAVDAIAGKNEEGDYSKLLDKATDIGVDIINEGLIQKFALVVEGQPAIAGDYSELLETAKAAVGRGVDVANIRLTPIGDTQPDRETLEIANYVGLMGMRLTEGMLDLEKEELPVGFVNFKTLDYTVGQFAKAAKMQKEWNRKLNDIEFTDGYERAVDLVTDPKNQNLMKDNIAKARYAGKIDFVNGTAQAASSALAHINAGLADEKDAAKAALHERSAKAVLSMYDAIVSDDALYSSKRLFEDEKETFRSGAGPNKKNMSWELDSVIGKFETYEKAADEAKAVMYDIAKSELIGDPGDARPIDGYLLFNIDKIKNMGEEMLGSTMLLFENIFSPAAQSYSKLDEARAKKCTEAEEKAGRKLQELSILYQTGNTVMEHAGDKRVSEPEFEMYHSMVKQQMTMPLGERRA